MPHSLPNPPAKAPASTSADRVVAPGAGRITAGVSNLTLIRTNPDGTRLWRQERCSFASHRTVAEIDALNSFSVGLRVAPSTEGAGVLNPFDPGTNFSPVHHEA